MTDQRPIDPSTLRDGDIVRAKRGEYGVVEGVFHSYPISSGWGIGSEAEEDGLFAWNDKGWTITDILRPVLVKGDRVEWTNVVTPRQGTCVGPREGGRPGYPQQSIVTNAEGRDVIVETDLLTRLPAAPEPAPIEVGDWLKSLMDKDSHVVTSVDGDWIGIRWWQSGAIYRVNRRSIEGWTRLDGPPEPPQGTVYVIGKTVWHADDWGHIAAAAGAVALEWSTVCGLYDTERLATLQIVHTMEVE